MGLSFKTQVCLFAIDRKERQKSVRSGIGTWLWPFLGGILQVIIILRCSHFARQRHCVFVRHVSALHGFYENRCTTLVRGNMFHSHARCGNYKTEICCNFRSEIMKENQVSLDARRGGLQQGQRTHASLRPHIERCVSSVLRNPCLSFFFIHPDTDFGRPLSLELSDAKSRIP